jgi:hypothetical protein
VYFSGTIVNDGKISGGTNTISDASEVFGGNGVYIVSSGNLINNGVIAAGAGGISGYRGYAGSGGIGLDLSGAVVTNNGTISGGAGGYAIGFYSPGNGGAGVYLNGGTLSTNGTIVGGAAGTNGDGRNGIAGDAVRFGKAVGTLIITPEAVFVGDIIANPTSNDVLVLEGNTHGSLGGFGTTVTGFTTIEESSGADWKLGGSITGTGSIELAGGATLTLDGTVSIATLSFASAGNDSLRLEDPASFTSTLSVFGAGDTVFLSGIEATSLQYSGHTLTLFDAGGAAVDTLTFDGKYTQADFGLDAVKGGTNLVFAGNEMTPTDTLYSAFGPSPVGAMAEAGGWPSASGFRPSPEDSVMLHFGHVLPLKF